MAIILSPNNGTLTTSSGTASKTIVIQNALLLHLLIKATTATTTFDIKIVDTYSNVLLERKDEVGCLNEELVLPVHSNVTLTILNASKDESFDHLLTFRES
jgi:hypothetical protein